LCCRFFFIKAPKKSGVCGHSHGLADFGKFNKSINAIGPKGCCLSKEGMADLILWNNIRWDRALLKQIQCYKQDGIFPWLADKNFSVIASAVSLKAGKIMFANKDTIYEIVPYKDIGE